MVVDGGSDIFAYYQSGILSDAAACGTEKSHEVVVVGYSMDGPIPYFIVRNSWGVGWGMNGYVNIAMQEGVGVCGI